MDWAQAWEPKGHQFDSQSGQMPAGQVPSGGHMRGNHTKNKSAFMQWNIAQFLKPDSWKYLRKGGKFLYVKLKSNIDKTSGQDGGVGRQGVPLRTIT